MTKKTIIFIIECLLLPWDHRNWSHNWSYVCAKSDGLNDRFSNLHRFNACKFLVLYFIQGMQRRGHAQLRNCWEKFTSSLDSFKLTKIDAKVSALGG